MGGESGNVIFFILMAIVLIGLVTAALRSGGGDANIDKESLFLKVTQARQHASELERAITFIMQNGASETDIRFAHPDAHSDYGVIATTPQFQVFSTQGGGAEYRLPPADVQIAAADWEFYSHTHIPGAGSSRAGFRRAELIAVLPDVTLQFCAKINEINNQTGAPDDNGGGCLHDTGKRFGTATPPFDDTVTVNLLDETVASFSTTPAPQACVTCGGVRHFYHVLISR